MVEPEAHPLIRTPGSRVGLLLGAGGIRGCAHAGVLSVLESAGIQPGIVVGASIGSLFGAAYAAEWPVERIERITYGAPRGAVAEFYKHRLRIDSSTYIGRILCELGADTRIEHLPRRYACMAIDCATGRPVALTRGPLLASLEASIALPGIARPVTLESGTYVDGGLRGPVPASVARDLGAEWVLHVELTALGRRRAEWRQAGRAMLTRLAARRLGPPAAAIPTKSDRDHTRPTSHADADFIIVPDFYGLFCNSPVGVRFCARRGEIAARRFLQVLDPMREQAATEDSVL